MDDFPLVGRYKLYKDGTARLLRWLTQTAHKCHNAASLFSGMKRKPARSGGAYPGYEYSAVSWATRDLVRLGSVIAADDKAAIDSNILEVVRDVIAGRESCAAWYRSLKSGNDSTATPDDESHAFFIGALKEVHDILSTARRTRSSTLASTHRQSEAKQNQSKGPAEQELLQNLFQHLQVEEPADNPFGTTTITIKEPDLPDKPEVSEEREDGIFARWCIVQDYDVLRARISALWEQYVSGKKSFLAAGMITDVAMGLMRHMSEKDTAPSVRLLEYVLFANNHMKESMTYRERTLYMRDGAFGLAVLAEEYTRLFEESTPWQRSLMDACHEGRFEVSPFLQTLLERAPSLVSVGSAKGRENEAGEPTLDITILDDEVSAGLLIHAFQDLKQFPFWLIAAVQASIDVHDILNCKSSVGVAALRKTIQDVRAVFDYTASTFGDSSIMAHRAWGRLDWFSEPYQLRAPDAPAKIPAEDQVGLDAVLLLAQTIPTMPAMAQFHIHFHALDLSLAVVNTSVNTLSLAHLYRAGQHYGLIPKPWKDMDFILANFIAVQSANESVNPIVTKVNANADAFAMARHFRMALGMAIEQRERRNRPKPPIFSKLKGFRVIKPKNALINAFLKMACTDQQDREIDLVGIVIRTMTKGESKTNTSKNRQSQTNTSITPLAVLEYFEQQMVLMEPVLNFDYPAFCAFYLGCIQSADLKYSSCSQILPDTPPLRPSHVFLDSILWNVADAVHRANPQNPEELRRVARGTYFGRIIEYLNWSIGFNGSDAHLKPALENSSGHIPKQMRPDIWPEKK